MPDTLRSKPTHVAAAAPAAPPCVLPTAPAAWARRHRRSSSGASAAGIVRHGVMTAVFADAVCAARWLSSTIQLLPYLDWCGSHTGFALHAVQRWQWVHGC